MKKDIFSLPSKSLHSLRNKFSPCYNEENFAFVNYPFETNEEFSSLEMGDGKDRLHLEINTPIEPFESHSVLESLLKEPLSKAKSKREIYTPENISYLQAVLSSCREVYEECGVTSE